jgi:hypothetical protein
MKGGDVDFSLTEIGVFLRAGSNLYIEFHTIDGGKMLILQTLVLVHPLILN